MDFVSRLRDRAQRHPERAAYTFLRSGEVEDDELGYGRLDVRARAVGAALQQLGAGGERALLLFPPGLDFIPAFFACLCAGAVAVPSYPPGPRGPQPRLRAIAQDARPRFVLTTAAVSERREEILAHVPELREAAWIATDTVDDGLADEWTGTVPKDEALAFLQYTSGSTSDRKGVVVTHGNLAHNEESIRQAFGQSEESVIVGWLPLYHDMGLIGNVLQPAWAGARCILLPPLSFLQQPARWLRAISRYRATTSGGPDFAYALCARKATDALRAELDLSSWRVAFNGAEPVRAATLARFAEAFAPCGFRREAFYPCYGLAEATLFVAGGRLSEEPVIGDLDARPLVGCGNAWGGQRIVIANPDTGEPCAPDRIGEIWVAGPSVARGYWERPEETAFAAYLTTGDGPFLRTGDLGFLRDGELFVAGRLKDLLILRGRNHYPQDLELTAEAGHAALRPGGSAAFPIEHEGEERAVLVCEVERRAGAPPEEIADAVRQAVSEEHEVRVHEVVLIRAGTLLRTSSGKVRRRACREAYLHGGLEVVGRSLAGATETPEEESAGSLRSIVARACRVSLSEVPPDRPLTRLGLDSLAAVEIQQAVDSAFGVSLSLGDLMGGATLSDLAARIGPHPPAPSPGPPESPALGEGEACFALTRGQKALWFLDRLSPESAACNLAAAARVEGELDAEALRGALAELVARHAVLRSTFGTDGERPVQRIQAGMAPAFAVEDASTWSEVRVRERLDGEARRPFDLETGPPFRVLLLAHGPGHHSLLLVVHHLVCDFWSLVVILSDLEALYRGVGLPSLTATYAGYAGWQERLLASPSGAELEAWWQGRLAGPLPRLELPVDRPRPAVQTYRGASVPLALDLSGLSRLCLQAETTPFTGLLAVFQALLHRLSGQNEILVGAPASGRGAAAWADVAGYFVNPVALRADLGDDPAFSRLLAVLRPAVLAAFAHQDFPCPPVFQAMLVLQKAQRPELEPLAGFALGEAGARIRWAGLELESIRLGWRPAPFDLTLSLTPGGEGSLLMNADLFDAATAQRWAGHFATLVRGAVADPQARIGDLPLLSEAELEQVLRGWNATAAELPGDVWIHRAVERQAAMTPEAVAVVCGGESATWRALDERANRIARHLRALGARPEARVGLSLERSVDMVAVLLGILKAGCAYVPLDPAYPRERLRLILEDAGVEMLVNRGFLDSERTAIEARSPAALPPPDLPDALAYVMYTSGSTGTPKGVMVSHRNVANFFAGMDRCLGTGPGCWLAVTSLSFDISVLELLWTLSRGFRVVVQEAPSLPGRPVDFSLFYFASDENAAGGPKYRLLLEGAKLADRRGFAAVWTPERHFHAFGGLYPNPAVTGAAVAAVTERVGVRAGSVVLPLHHPVRVAEEWAVVDNLSGGRVGISFASGWNAADFVFAPDRYGPRREQLREQIDTVRRLWRGEAVRLPGGAGEVEVRTLPRPVQPELPFWITAAASPGTFELAGEMGANLLTHLLGQGLRDLAERIALYRSAWRNAGHAGEGRVSLMLHTFVGEDPESVRETVRGPFTKYLASSLDLMKALAPGEDPERWSEEDRRALLDRAFDRYFETSGLFGTPEACLRRVRELSGTGVDEIACLIDFGVDEDTVLASLERLASVRDASFRAEETLPALIVRHGVTHLQCTPSAATALLADPEAPAALGRLRRLMVGGEALPQALSERLAACAGGELLNMYGPTETTVWSMVGRIGRGERVTLGRPIANTEARVVDGRLQPVPAGRPGELLLGGEGVTRGYHGRPDLTAERFLPDPWSGRPGSRLYRTGDLVKWLPDGRLDFLGRIDAQLKIRGHRVEPGEIEAALLGHPDVREAAVAARPEPSGALRLVAWVVSSAPAAELRSFLAARLPPALVPSVFVPLESLPRTPNGKLDRRALSEVSAPASEAPATVLEETVAAACREVLGLERIGRHDDLFELGCHSLSATQILARLRESLGVQLALRDLFGAPTVSGLGIAIERASGCEEMPSLQPVPRDGDLPLSFAQERIWFLHQLAPESVAYHVPRALRIRGPLSLPLLEAAFGEVVRRHEIFRTTFPARDGRAVQAIHDPWRVSIPVIDLRSLGPSRGAWLACFLAEHGQRPFDLERLPLVRLAAVRLEDEEHVLVMTEHHLVHDGWAEAVLLREVLTLYAAFGSGEPSPLPALPVQYADFAVWQRRWLGGDVLERQLAWWRERLAGAPERLELPADLPRPAVRSSRGDVLVCDLPPGLARAVGGSTLFMTLTAVFKALLWRYSGQEDLCVGTVLANRRVRELEGLLGMIANTLVLRTDLGGDPAFGELVERVREVCLGAYEHQDMPVEKLVEALSPGRSLGHSPLFQVTFSLLDVPLSDLALPGLELELVDSHNRSAKFDLNVTAMRRAEEVSLRIEYSTDLFRRDTAERLAGHYLNLLAGAAADPKRRISELPLLSEAERAQALAWSAGPARVRRDVHVHDLVAAWAAEAPEALAVAAGSERLTYGELVRRSGALAARLRSLGAGPEDKVAVLADRSPDMVAGLLAVLSAGAAYVPLDLSHPAERLAFLLEDVAARVVLVQERLLGKLPRTASRTVVLDGPHPPAPSSGPPESPSPGEGEALAYVIHTSGSTGAPKGVEVSHASLMNLVDWHLGEYGIGPSDRVSQVAALGFDAAVWEIWPCLAAGASLHMPDEETRAAPAKLRDWLAAERITVSFLPTPLAEAVLDLGWPAESLRVLLTGGDRLRRGAPEGFELVNHYGPTEGTVVATSDRVGPGAGAPPIGRPIANVRAHVLGPGGGPAPAGVPGELWIGGAGLARGYLRRPDLTAERFRPDPFEPGARLYGTGDRVRRLPDGRLDFLGRVDHQVKLRGVRIEPAEVEAELAAHPGVRAAAVVAREDRLIAGFVGSATPAELRGHLRRRLPEAMIPAAFVRLDELPLTPHGKVDRRALAALPLPDEVEERGFLPPRTPVEEILCGLWAELLERERAGVRDSFFDLGGHSLLATRLLARVREALGVDVPLRRLFELPTPEGLARAVEEMRGAPAEAPPLHPVTGGGDLPLSFAQERLWLVDRLEPGSPVYNIPAVVLLEGELDTEALRRALETVVARHGALRTTFRETGGRPVQIVAALAPPSAVRLPLVDLEGLPETARPAEILRLTADEALRPFDLEAGPLLRATLVRSGPADHRLLLTLHHIVADGWSMGVLVREVQALYGGGADLPALPVQYADFAVWQREWLRGEVLERHLAWWRERLAGAPAALDLPTDRPRPAVADRRGAGGSRELPPRLWAAVEALARREGATPFLAVLAVLQALLARYTGAGDLTVGTPVAGRAWREVEDLIGFFVNTLVLRGDLPGDPPFRVLLSRAREALLDAHAHQHLPFERLVEELAPERDLGRTPLFQVMLASGDVSLPPLELPGLRLTALEAEARTSKFDLTVFVTPRDHGALLRLVYRTDLFDPSTVERMAGHLANLVEGVVSDPDRRLSELPLMGEAERRELAGLNRTRREFPLEGTVHEAFAEQVRRTPDALAVAAEGRSLTFAELDRRARSLAAWLLSRGVGPEVRVGLSAGRSIDAIAGILGIWMAGGAYVPIDPAWPAERVSWMMEDSGAALLLAGEIAEEGGGALSRAAGEGRGGGFSDGAAYVIYTSGSTGRPKGVVVRHRSVLNLARALREAVYGETGPLRVAVNASLSFDGSVKQVVQLLSGHSLHPVPEEARLDPAAMAEWLRRERIDVLDVTPSQLRPLLAFEDTPPLVLVGGEAVDQEIRQAARSRPRTRFVNVYGPTECTVDATAADVARARVPASIGGPLPNVRVHLVDRWGRPAPEGVPGELWIGGEGVARGYLGRPGLTAERFVPDPFGDEPGGRLYRSGDLGRRRHGEIEYLGRIDRQVKIRGYRVEPGEVEAALRGLPGVREAAVVARDGRLAAYLEPASLSLVDLKRGLESRLPSYLVPSSWTLLERLPLTASGKIDREALPAPADRVASGGFRAPSEELLAGIFADLLGAGSVGSIGREDDFFALGGHSLLAAQVVSRLREPFGVEVPLRTLFESSTVAGLARAVDELAARDACPAAPPIRPVPRGGDLPLSFSQERLWFLDRLDPGSPAYNIPIAVRLDGVLDIPALERALAGLVRRHESLRTTFRTEGGRPVQAIAPRLEVALPVVDPGGEAEALRLADGEALRPFDLEAGPLLRAVLIRLEDRRHVLFLTLHHIVSDGWSTGVLVRDLAALYRGAEPPPLPVQYADYAVWQREWLTGSALEPRLAWWRGRLAGLPASLDLPVDRPRPAVSGVAGAAVPVSLPEKVWADLGALARGAAATPFLVVLAAVQALLARSTGADDLAIGTPVAGRDRLELEGLVGFFVNTLVLRADLSGDPPFRTLLGRAREEVLAAHAHQDLPFERLVEELAPERDLGRTPLFQVLLVSAGAADRAVELKGLSLAPLETEPRVAKLDLTFTLSSRGLRLLYRTGLFDASTAERMAGHLANLIRGAMDDPGRRLSELPLMGEAEQRELIGLNRTRREFSLEGTVHEAFAEQVLRTPDALAVAAEGRSLTFAGLDRRARALAAHLRRQGVGPESRVGLAAGRSVDAIAGILGIWMAGGAYVPADPSWPAERVSWMLADSGAALLLTEIPEAEAFSLPAVLPDGAAYVIYTSGSTGTPKGVVVRHRSVLNLTRALREAVYGETGPLRVAVNASLSFDGSVKQVVQLLSGHSLHPVPEAARLDPAVFSEWLRRERIDVLDATPSQLRPLLAFGDLPPLVLVGGEAVDPEIRQAARSRPGTRFVNVYGPTECTVDATAADIALSPVPAAIGRPLPNVRVHLVDRWGRRTPEGVPGELWIGGEGVARGYLNRPGLTAEHFVPDPFGGEPGGRLYRSGDLGCLRGGEIEYLGRIDRQVKIRGYRIEPGEVEAALRGLPGVREAVVEARGGRLAAWLAPGDLSVAELKRRLESHLPSYLVPSSWTLLERLPLNASGKIDRGSLPEPGGAIAPEAPPRTATEELLAGIFADVLEVGEVGRGSDFFALGGHSLLAARLAARVREAFGVELPLRALFETPAVADLAERLDELARADRGAAPVADPPLAPVSRSLEPPLSFAQQSLWLIDRMEGGSASYNVTAAVELAGRLDAATLAGSLADVVDRHEILRTGFVLRGAEPRQVIHARLAAPLLLADLSGLPEDRRGEARDGVRRALRRPFDLERPPLLRAVLLRLEPELHLLALCQHHIVSDARSMGVLVQELAAGYEARLQGRRAALPSLPVQYADYADWQRRRLRGAALERLLAFWHRQLGSDPPFARLPAGRPAPAVRTRRGGRRSFPLAAGLETELRGLARREGVTLFMLLLAVFQTLLHRATGQEDLVVGAAVAGRDRIETEGLIGCFLNMLPLRAAPAAHQPFRRLLRQVREACLDAFAHQELPFERLMSELRLRRDEGRSPLQVAFGVQSAPPLLPALPGLEVRPLEWASDAARLDLTLWVTDRPEGLSAAWTWSADLFDGADAARLHARYEALLAAVLADPDAPLRDLDDGEKGQEPAKRWAEVKGRRLREVRRRPRPVETEMNRLQEDA